MRAGFQCAVKRGSPGPLSSCSDGMNFGMRASELLMPTLTDELQLVVNDHCTDQRIRLDSSQSALSQLDCVPHDRLGRVELHSKPSQSLQACKTRRNCRKARLQTQRILTDRNCNCFGRYSWHKRQIKTSENR